MFLLNKPSWPEFSWQDTILLNKDTIPGQFPDSAIGISNVQPSATVSGDSFRIQSTETGEFHTITPAVNEIAQTISNISPDFAKLPEENIPYYIPDNLNLYQNNQTLKNFSNHLFSIRETSDLIYKEQGKPPDSLVSIEPEPSLYKNKTLSQDINPDWLIGIVIGSLILIAALKLFFNKFFDQVLVAMWNFQLGSKFLRDQGVFSRRVGFVLNINFLLVSGLFIYLVLNHFNINPFLLNPFPAYLVYTSILSILLLMRYLLIVLTGVIFNRQSLLREYLYHILIIYKNVGIFFIPIVFCIAYIQENLRIYFIILALVLVALAYLFRFYKGFQIIIKKDVLIFYLILYLCTLEILPVLFYYKFFSGLI